MVKCQEGARSKADKKKVWRKMKCGRWIVVLSADFVNSTVSGDLAGTVGKTCGVQRSSSVVLAGGHFQHAGKKWECSQGENEPEERCELAHG